MGERSVIYLTQVRWRGDRPNPVETSKKFTLPVGGAIAERFSIFSESRSKDNFGTNRGHSLVVVYKKFFQGSLHRIKAEYLPRIRQKLAKRSEILGY